MEKKKVWLGSFLVIIAAVLWGLDGVVLTPRLYNLPVPFVVFLLHAIPFALMNLVFYKEYKKLKEFKIHDLIFMGLIALFGGALGTLSIVKALFLVNFHQLSIVVLLQKLQPIFAIILARLILKEKTGKDFIIWATIAIIAAYFLTFGLNTPHIDANNKNTILAAMYSVLAAFSFGSATVFGKFIVTNFDFKTATFFRYGFTTIIMSVILLFTKGFVPLSNVTKANWIVLLIITFTTGAGAIALYYYGLKFIDAHISTICELAFPLSAAFFDVVINKSVLSPVQWIAAFVLMLTIVKISLNQNEVIEYKKA
ncbi:MAG: hypothetical protein PWP46_648 [Fusobacteriaceae bacterium]|nr:hypothetical protein [Fusobacteriaceae bacterium]